MGARIPLPHIKFNIPLRRDELKDSIHESIPDFPEFGFPLGVDYTKEQAKQTVPSRSIS